MVLINCTPTIRAMKNVLIPTDFTLSSLELVSNVAYACNDTLNIMLFHAFEMPDSTIDAIHRLNQRSYNDLISADVRQKCRGLKAQHANIGEVTFRIMYGSTTAAFCNFAEAHSVDMLAIADGQPFKPAVSDSVDYRRMFRKSGIAMMEVKMPVRNNLDYYVNPVAGILSV